MAGEIEIIGEVIEASTTEFAAESRELHSPPPFGSFVKVSWSGKGEPISVTPPIMKNDIDEDPFEDFRRAAGSFNPTYRSEIEGESISTTRSGLDPAVYAIVYHAATGPTDSGRKLRAFWKDEDQLQEEQPELSEWMLVTHFKAVIIGHSLDGTMQQLLPPQPPKLFSGVRVCAESEVREITSRMDFLRTLVNSKSAPTEEVVAACIREAYRAHGERFDFLVTAGRELAGLLKDDYDRLQAIIRRVSP